VLTQDENLMRNQLLPVAAAAALAYQRLYARDPGASPANAVGQDLNAIADVLATMVDLYTFSPTGTNIRKLTADEVSGGSFENSARELTFRDGRQTIARLAVLAADFDRALEYLKAHRKPSAGSR
jgi:hypothetical protein